jgi:site-specific DNA-methyltransferase (adenine-specific)
MINLIHGDCITEMQKMDDCCIDLTVTSPPYDNLRTYKDSLLWNEDIWKSVILELYRITKQGGVVVWVVGDATIKGSETGTSFKQALYAMDCGFNLHDTMIWQKPDAKPLTHNRYEQSFEYMFILSKGKPNSFNGIKDKQNKHAGTNEHGTWRCRDGKTKRKSGHNVKVISEFGLRHNIFSCVTVKSNKFNHPAPFPEKLANDHIISWSNENDVVFDPFMGSGTTGKMAKINNRRFIGIEKVEEYFNIAKERINKNPA